MSGNEERKIIKEIETVEKSEPIFAQIDKLKASIIERKKEKQAIYDNLAPTNKIITELKAKITKVKQQEGKFEDAKQDIKHEITNLGSEMDRIQDKIRELRKENYDAKEEFYGQMCDYEI